MFLIVAKSEEFDNIRVREEEVPEIRETIKQFWVFEETLQKPRQRGANEQNIESVTPIENHEKVHFSTRFWGSSAGTCSSASMCPSV